MKGLTREEAATVKERFLAELGIPHTRIANSLYNLSGQRVNVKVTSKRPTGRYWFNIQRTNVQSYIWICYDAAAESWEAYYWIPAREMWNLVNQGSYKDRTWEKTGRSIPNFVIDVGRDLYIGGQATRLSISRFRDSRKTM